MSIKHLPSFNSKQHANSKTSTRFGRIPYSQVIDSEVQEVLSIRKQLKIEETIMGGAIDVTPKLLQMDDIQKMKYKQLNSAIKKSIYGTGMRSSRSSAQSRLSIQSRGSLNKSKVGGLKLSLDDVLLNVGSINQVFRDINYYDIFDDVQSDLITSEYKQPYIKITLLTTQDYLLFEMVSITEPKGTPIGDYIEEDNKVYDYLTIGRGMVRRRSDAETQTNNLILKNRFVNTFCKEVAQKASYVSFYEVHDTYKAITAERNFDYKVVKDNNNSLIDKMTPKMYLQEQLKQIGKNANFVFNSMIMERLLASNVYKEGQKRFRNMELPTKTDTYADYQYDPKILFKFNAPSFETSRITGKMRKAVSDISFCYNNGDIIAVAYGLFSYSALITVSTGNVCIWSIKNPQNPERNYKYNSPVTAIEFSPFLPFLLAIGMFDGAVEVRNITKPNDPPIAITQRSTSPNREPVVAIKWYKQPQQNSDIDPIFALSLNGTVWKYCIIGGPYLLSFNQMELQRVEGTPEGVPIEAKTTVIDWCAHRHPLGLNITMHPLYKDIYYLLTDEGCVYQCSTNHTHSYSEMWRTHEGSVNCMDFSPWSPKLFLTCGNDWCIRIWMEGIFKPLITLTYKRKPIYAAQWSRTHSNVIISVSRSHVEIWDIRRNLLAPVSRKKFSTSFNTMFKYNSSGTSVAFGNERGDVHICALDKMPFPPHFQYDELRKALFDAISTSPDLMMELKSIGFFGYKNKGFVRPP